MIFQSLVIFPCPSEKPQHLFLLVNTSPLFSWPLESQRWGWQNEVIYPEKIFSYCDCCCCSLENRRNDRNICEELAKWVEDRGIVRKPVLPHSCRWDGRIGLLSEVWSGSWVPCAYSSVMRGYGVSWRCHVDSLLFIKCFEGEERCGTVAQLSSL